MTESKIELTERLRGEGRWAEASRFKDTALKDFRDKGMKRDEATATAWEAMATAYPPIGEAAPETPDATAGKPSTEHDSDIDALLDRIGDGQPSDLVRDTLWAYENLANRRIKASDAPSCGAWALLEWARQYRNRFFEQVLPKAMLSKPPEEEANVREAELRAEEIELVLQKFDRKPPK
jgi:hypothetical protein